jgi:hypothetical protein
MRRVVLIVFATAALLWAAFGCGNKDCTSLCNESVSQKCAMVTGGSCGTYCGAMERLAAVGNCKSQFDATLDCANNGSVCETDNRCGAQATAFATCVTTYCTSNPTNTDCKLF